MAELTPIQKRAATISALIKQKMPYLRNVIQKGIDPERFAKVAITVISKSERLLLCTPQSLMGCLLQSAQLGLDLDPALGLAYMVPYKTTATFITGYQGLMELARRTHGVSRITARGVFEGDEFDYELGTSDWIHHKPVMGERGPLVYVYAIAHLVPPSIMQGQRGKSGAWEFTPSAATVEFVVLSKGEVDRFRSRSRAANDGPWVTDYNAMAMKTAVRRLATWLPKSPQLGQALRLDDQADRDEPQDFGDLTIDLNDAPETPAAPALDRLTASLPPAQTSVDDAQLKAAAERQLREKAYEKVKAADIPMQRSREPGEEG
jgi:recombination protein RecT